MFTYLSINSNFFINNSKYKTFLLSFIYYLNLNLQLNRNDIKFT